MWKCEKCGHESGKKTKSSYGCDHVWWDKDEFEAKQREKEARQQAEEEAEIQRKVIEFNDYLWNTEEGLKQLKGEKGWDWLKGEDWNHPTEKIEIHWRNSSFGTEWFRSEYGQKYLDYFKSLTQTTSNVGYEGFLDYDTYIYIGENWPQTEEGKQYKDALQVLFKKKMRYITFLVFVNHEIAFKEFFHKFDLPSHSYFFRDKMNGKFYKRIVFKSFFLDTLGDKLEDVISQAKKEFDVIDMFESTEGGIRFSELGKVPEVSEEKCGDSDVISNIYGTYKIKKRPGEMNIKVSEEKELKENENEKFDWLSEKKSKKWIGPLGVVILVFIIAIIANVIAILIF